MRFSDPTLTLIDYLFRQTGFGFLCHSEPFGRPQDKPREESRVFAPEMRRAFAGR